MFWSPKGQLFSKDRRLYHWQEASTRLHTTSGSFSPYADSKWLAVCQRVKGKVRVNKLIVTAFCICWGKGIPTIKRKAKLWGVSGKPKSRTQERMYWKTTEQILIPWLKVKKGCSDLSSTVIFAALFISEKVVMPHYQFGDVAKILSNKERDWHSYSFDFPSARSSLA